MKTKNLIGIVATEILTLKNLLNSQSSIASLIFHSGKTRRRVNSALSRARCVYSSDYCASDEEVVEYHCYDRAMEGSHYNCRELGYTHCPSGQKGVCIDGACKCVEYTKTEDCPPCPNHVTPQCISGNCECLRCQTNADCVNGYCCDRDPYGPGGGGSCVSIGIYGNYLCCG
jgi:hypothetical protein